MGHLKRGGSMENDGTPRIFTLFQVTLEMNHSHLLRIADLFRLLDYGSTGSHRDNKVE